MTDRDHFAAAALTGLLARRDCYDQEIAVLACNMADAMLRERCRSGGDCPSPDNAANHDAAPAARASVGRPRTDNADLPTRAGTGDTPDSPQPIACSVFDRSQPINGPDPDSRVWETPVHTPAPHATPGEGSVPREGTQEPVAWAVMLADGERIYDVYATEEEAKAIDEAVTGNHGVVPLYRSPTLTDAEAETLRELRDEAAQYADEIGLCASEVRVRQRIIDGLLERTGGGR